MGPKPTSEVKLRQVLKQAYRQRAAEPAPAADPQALMRRVRHLAASEAASPGVFLDRLFWRLAPVAGALIAVLAVVAVNLDFAPDAAWSMLSYENEAADMVQTLLL